MTKGIVLGKIMKDKKQALSAPPRGPGFWKASGGLLKYT
jgi:hypothetical protein